MHPAESESKLSERIVGDFDPKLALAKNASDRARKAKTLRNRLAVARKKPPQAD